MDMLADWTENADQNLPVVLEELSLAYDEYCTETLSGGRGRTAQFWMNYCQHVELFLLFHRSVKENDVRLNACDAQNVGLVLCNKSPELFTICDTVLPRTFKSRALKSCCISC